MVHLKKIKKNPLLCCIALKYKEIMPILRFKGKNEIHSHHLGVPFHSLEMDKEKSLLTGSKKQPSLDDNLIIHGDNLYALKALLPRYTGKIKCIYIDPPYNTGKETWIFNDNVNNPTIKEWLNKEVGSEDLERHDKWLCMMWPRLNLLKELLSKDGVLICAIDHNEQEHLGLLLREIFPEKEIVCITVVHNPRGIQGDNFSYTHEYAYFVFPKSKEIIGQRKFTANNIIYRNLQNDGGESLRSDAKNCFYPIIVKNDKIIGFGEVLKDNQHPKKRVIQRKDGSYEIWPIDKHGVERKWRYARQSAEKIKHLLRTKKKNGKSEFEIEIEKEGNGTTENMSNFRNWGGESLRSDAKNCFYPIIIKNDKIIGFGEVLKDNQHPKKRVIQRKDGSYEIWPIDKHGVERKWRYARQSAEKIKHLLRTKKKNGKSEFEIEIGKDFASYRTVWTGRHYDSNEYGTKFLKRIIPNCPFNFPKSFFTVKECLQAVCSNNKNSIILDSFAGSGTTAHAVLDMNKEDGGNRKFILIQCEEYNKEKQKPANITNTITAERVRRVINGIPTEKDEKLQKGLGGAFTYCTLGEEISAENLIKAKNLPSYDTLSRYIFHTATGEILESLNENKDFYVGQTSKRVAVFVIYKPDKNFLRSKDSALNLERTASVFKLRQLKNCKKAYVFAMARFVPLEELSEKKIVFCQIPFAIHRIIGG